MNPWIGLTGSKPEQGWCKRRRLHSIMACWLRGRRPTMASDKSNSVTSFQHSRNTIRCSCFGKVNQVCEIASNEFCPLRMLWDRKEAAVWKSHHYHRSLRSTNTDESRTVAGRHPDQAFPRVPTSPFEGIRYGKHTQYNHLTVRPADLLRIPQACIHVLVYKIALHTTCLSDPDSRCVLHVEEGVVACKSRMVDSILTFLTSGNGA